MTSLHLIVNVFQCKQGQVFPQSKSAWSRSEMWKVLSLSGLNGPLPEDYSTEDLVNMLLTRLNVQRPVVYALRTEDAVILNSQSVEVRGDLIHMGFYAALSPLSSGHKACDAVWSVFAKHTNEELRRFTIVKDEPEKIRELRMHVVELEQKVEHLEKAAAETGQNRLEQQFHEADQLLKHYRAQLRQAQEAQPELEQKNLALRRHVETLNAQKMQLEQQLQKVRQTLGENWETKIHEVQRLKEALARCRERLTSAGSRG
jgi:vacuolar-type H+-ATPase subunit I/STV1